MNRSLSEDAADEAQATNRVSLEPGSREAINPLWRLSDPLTVVQAAALIGGFDPNLVVLRPSGGVLLENEGFVDMEGTRWVGTAFAGLVNAINANKLNAIIRRKEGYEPAADYSEETDWSQITIAVHDLVAWLEAAGIRPGFFFPAAEDAPDYLDPKNPRYAPKLAAAVMAWMAVTDPGGKHPKQALAKWLREHAAEFGLTDDEGRLNDTGIDEVAKVANWQPGGGAPKTPSE